MGVLTKLRDTVFESSFANQVVEFLIDTVEHDEVTLLETDSKLFDVYKLVKKRVHVPSWSLGTGGEAEEIIIVHSHLDVKLLTDVVNLRKVQRVIYVARRVSIHDAEHIRAINVIGKDPVRITYGHPA